MKAKLFSLLLVTIFSSTIVLGQKISFGILGGVNFQNLNGTDTQDDKLELDLLTGFHAGVNVQIPVAPDFVFQHGLLFSIKGAVDKSGSEDTKIKLSCLELPLNIVYKGLVGKGHVMIGFGPYLGYAIGGKIIEGDVKTDIEFKNETEANGTGFATFKRFDMGANIFAGYELENGIFFQLDTQLGLLKINPDYTNVTDDKTSIKNTGFGLSVGYRF